MPTRRLDDPPSDPPTCRHPDHEPASHRVFPPGDYEHTCPACGARTYFRSRGVALSRIPFGYLPGAQPVSGLAVGFGKAGT